MGKENNFTHFDNYGNAVMVDVTDKKVTVREAVAKGRIKVNKDVFQAIENRTVEKGDVLGIARVAGIMGAKKTSDLIPMCHILAITKASVNFNMDQKNYEIEAVCTIKVTGKTGVEMEALTGVNMALLTIYDMCKAIDKEMMLKDIYLEHKSGGKSGDYSCKRR